MHTDKVVDHSVGWLKTYASNARTNRYVIGTSGAYDTAVTSVLCDKPGLKVLRLEMPIHQAESHVNRAEEHIEQLKKRFSNVDDKRIDLTPVFEEFTTH